MGMTITEKILAPHTGVEKVTPGDLINSKIDIVMGHDRPVPPAIEELERIGADRVFDTEEMVLVPSHFTPNKDVKYAENCKRMREFARRHQISHYYEVGEMGIAHALRPERGVVLPGDMVVGGDSHMGDGLPMPKEIGAVTEGLGNLQLRGSYFRGLLEIVTTAMEPQMIWMNRREIR